MKIEKPSQFLAIIAWISVFLEAWLLITRRIPSDGIAWGFWIFFLIIACLSSAFAWAPVKRSG